MELHPAGTPPIENIKRGFTISMTGTADVAAIAAPGAGLRLYITEVTILNNHATVATIVEMKSAAAAIYKFYAKALDSSRHYTFKTPIRLVANEALNFKNATTGSAVIASASGYVAP